MNYYFKKFLDELKPLNIEDSCIVTEEKYVEVCVGGTSFRFWPDMGVGTMEKPDEVIYRTSLDIFDRLKAAVVLRELGD